MPIDESEKREYFSFELLTKKRAGKATRTLPRLIQEFLALTLLSNRDVAKVLETYGQLLGWAEQLPMPIYDQWLGRQSRTKCAWPDIAETAERKVLRKQITRLRGNAYREIEQKFGLIPRNVEHISLRFFPVQVVKPQSRGGGKAKVLMAAYHLERCWIHFKLEDACSGYAEGQAITASTLTRRQWGAFVEALRDRQAAESGLAETPLVLHAPAGSGLKAVLADHRKIGVAEDMPCHLDDGVVLRILHKTKHSIARPLPQVSLAELFREPSIDERLSDVEMRTLPALQNLSHRQKDKLITTLWATVTALRQRGPSASVKGSLESSADEVL
ncbi:hypothetical protein [Propionivibrio sp.]|uniref:hypothetical protein n=1 Tax=Propionivibrio sp. TaxID=2212460 RepID=UPI00261CC2EA|nr:hypothetical protein [Propionivibrio sp.]